MELTGKTTGIFLKENASRLKNNTAIEYGSWKCSWAELDEVTDLLAARFMSLYGIHTGSHVGIWSLNSPAFVQTVLALYKIGAVAVVFNTANSVDEMADQLELSDTSILFYGPGSRGCIFDQMIPAIRKKAPGVQRFIHIEEKEGMVVISRKKDRKTFTLFANLSGKSKQIPSPNILFGYRFVAGQVADGGFAVVMETD